MFPFTLFRAEFAFFSGNEIRKFQALAVDGYLNSDTVGVSYFGVEGRE